VQLPTHSLSLSLGQFLQQFPPLIIYVSFVLEETMAAVNNNNSFARAVDHPADNL